MATEDILIRYRADVSQLETDINKVIASQEQLTKATQQNTQAQQKAVTSAEFAAKKRAQLLDAEVKKLKSIRDAQKLAFDPDQIDKYNRQIQESEKRIDLLSGKFKKAAQQADDGFNQIRGTIQNIAGAFGLAFSAEALISFSKRAVEAFIQAERNVKLLESAIVGLGGESRASFEALSQQAEVLGAVTLESDDAIRQASVTLKNYGLSASQIGQILPGLIGLSRRTGDSLESFATKVGSALEGAGKQFKNLGANIDANKTQLENYNELLRALGGSANQAALDTDDLTDSLTLQQKKIDQLEEDIGGKLAPAWTAAYSAALQYAATILNLPTVGKEEAGKALPKIQAETDARVKQLRDEGKTTSDIIAFLRGDLDKAQEASNRASQNFIDVQDRFGGVIATLQKLQSAAYKNLAEVSLNAAATADEIGKTLVANIQQQIDFLNDQQRLEQETLKTQDLKKLSIQELQKLLEQNQTKNDLAAQTNVKNIEKEIEARKKAGEEAKKTAEEIKKLLDSLDDEIRKVQAELEKRKIEVIPADSQKAQEDRIKALADLNEKAINDEIQKRIKAVEEDAKLSTKQKNEVIAKYNELKAARLALAQFNEQNELNIISAEQVKRIEDAAKQLDDLNIEQALTIEADKVEAANEAVAKSFEDLGKAVSKEDFAIAKEAATARTAALNQALNEELNINKTRIENAREAELAKVKEGEAADAERAAINQKYDNQILNATKKTNQDIADNNKNLNDQIETQEAASYERRTQQTFQYLDATAQVLSELGNLYGQFTQQRIAEIEEIKQAEIEAIDESLKINEDNFELRRITEEQFKNEKIRLEKEKVKAEEEALKKVKNLKKQQAILDKTNALFQIAINTAKNITEQPGPFGSLIGLWIALGLAQAGVVAAQPIPYRKGSKDTGPEGHMARVGEEGEEFVWMPANSKVLPARQTKKYADVIDAMYDNKLDDYIYKHYITPQLIAQKQAKESQQSKSFAQNMADSIVYNQSGLTASDLERQRRKGQYINNVDELANAIAKKLPSFDPYRN